MMLCARKGERTASFALRHGLQHAPRLVPLIGSLLSELSLAVRELALVVSSLGPGSFTGIRIGLATAQGISFGASCPVVGVSTLDAFAAAHSTHRGDVYPVIDARKGRYYTALFRAGERVGEYLDISPRALSEMLLSAEHPLLAGPESGDIHAAIFPDGRGAERVSFSPYVDPLALLRLGERAFERDGSDPSRLVPIYLRQSEAEISAGMGER
jgi:tRNA threonylcarbamoyladenosine biosynthesis protein TsaB